MIIVCENCNIKFNKTQYRINKDSHHYCSKQCYGESRVVKFEPRQRINDWKIIKFLGLIKKQGMYQCECVCGRIYPITGNRLKSGKATRCIHCKKRQYVGKVSASYFDQVKVHAFRKKLSCEITQQDVWNKCVEQDHKCALSGLELTWQDGSFGEPGNASLDRINSNHGYILKNIQIIDKDINQMKFHFQQDYFLFLCNKIAVFDQNFPLMDYIETNKHSNWKGFGEISGSYWGNIKYRAKNDNIPINIMVNNLWEQYVKQGGLCYYTGMPIYFEPKHKNRNKQTASIDRFDSNFGYLLNNFVVCHKHINTMKWNLNAQYFTDLCKKVNNYHEYIYNTTPFISK